MGTGTIVAIVVGVIVIAAILFFVTRGKNEELPPGGAEAPPKKPVASTSSAKAVAKAAPTKSRPTKAEPSTPKKPAAEEPADADDADADDADADNTDADDAEAPADDAEAPAEGSEDPAAEDAPATAHETQSAAKSGPSEEDVKALKKGLASTRGGFISRLAKLFSRKKEIDPALLDDIQEVLLTADIGVKTADRILERLKDRMDRKELGDEDKVWEALREEAGSILGDPPPLQLEGPPAVILVVGVNGVGKTTTIGKLASRYHEDGKKVILAAGDTFRAAAVMQLEVWGRRVGCEVVKGRDRADPASVIFDAIKKAEADGADIVIADTAGRLHTKSNLMEELKKVVRTAEKALGRPLDEILLVLDSTTGQNAIQQAELFKAAIDVSGIALTKLDGTAKGGVILGIVDAHALPVHFIGIGERVEDLREFEASSFVEALFAKPEDDAAA
ncbi:MAG: signal recognition particle-docking protein FtsY [Sandaracinaceae bacterium]